MAKNMKRWCLRALVSGLRVLSLLIVFVGCNRITQDEAITTTQEDNRVTLVAGPPMYADFYATTGYVTFVGAGHLTLSAADFTVTPGATIVDAVVRSDTVRVYLTFAAIDRSEVKNHVVAISETSATIKGPARVKVIQALRWRYPYT
jgi:hypothetical protein